MPTFLTIGPYHFYAFSFDCSERPHVHVDGNGHTAKFWIDRVELFRSQGFRAHELRRIQRIIEAHQEELLTAWRTFCR